MIARGSPMNLSFGYIKNENQFLLKEFVAGTSDLKGKILDLDDLAKTPVQAVIYPEELNQSQSLISVLADVKKFAPIKSDKEIGFAIDQFEKMNFDQMQTIFTKTRDSWVLNNNLALIENLFATIDHMTQLLHGDRTAFFEELWFSLRSNLGASNLTIIFNDLRKATKEHEKDKLVKVKVEGEILPAPVPGDEFADQVMKHYENSFHAGLEFVAYDHEKGELVATVTILKSPVLMMAKVGSLSRLQKATLAALFDGINAHGNR
tara:strand:- start:1431 stop:2219 length:789 start_codon:yes stop_codon:yes gene_type:complete